MAVKLSRSRLTQCALELLFLVAIYGAIGTLGVPRLAFGQQQDTQQPNAQQLHAEAKAAQTIEQQNQVLQKIERLREQSTNDALSKYLINLEAWLLHQRGELHAKLAAEAAGRGETEKGRELDAYAMQDFDAAIGLDPKRWKSFHHRGVCFALAGQFENALKDFSKTVELKPDYANAWFNRGEIHYELGDFAAAIKDYSEAIRLQPEDAGFYTSRGHTFFQLRRFRQALADYDRAVEIAPESSEFFANRGDAYRSIGQWENAANDFRKAIKLDNSFGRAYQGVAWLMATCPDPVFRNQELAIKAAQKAIELDGDSDYIYLDTLAAALANNGKFAEAETTMRRAIQGAPPENAAPLKARLKLYTGRRPFRQMIASTAQRSTGQRNE